MLYRLLLIIKLYLISLEFKSNVFTYSNNNKFGGNNMYLHEKEILSIEDLCEILNIGKNTAYSLLSNSQIKAFRIGRIWKIPRQALIDYIQSSLS